MKNENLKIKFLENIPNIRESDAFYSKNYTPENPPKKEFSNMQIYRAMLDSTLSSLFYSFNTIVIKETKLKSNLFTSFNFSLWRGITSSIVLYFYIKKIDPAYDLFSLSKIKHINWFILRTVGFYIGFVFFCWTIIFLRVSLGQVLCSINPVFSIIISAIALKEKLYWRYLIGILICFIGSSIIVLNEKSNTEKDSNSSYSFHNLILGVTSALINCICSGFVNVGQKVLTDDKMSNNVQVFYVSVVLVICSTIICAFQCNFGFDIWVMSLGTLNGVFYYLANHFFQESLKVLNVGGSVPFVYFIIVFVFIESVLILGEHVYFTDIFGSLIILSFHLYNAWYPIKS